MSAWGKPKTAPAAPAAAPASGAWGAPVMATGQRRALEFLKKHLSNPRCPDFQKWDADGDGKISPEELRSMFAKGPKIVLSDNMLHDIVSVADQDGDGQIDVAEFSKFQAKAKQVAKLRVQAKSRGVNVSTPSTSELADPKLAYSKLWDLDVGRLTPGKEYEANLQTYTTTSRGYRNEDWAKEPLFTRVDPAVFQRGTFKMFKDLMDNYETEVGSSEKVTAEELKEEMRFVSAVCASPVMKYVEAYCKKKHWGPWERDYKAARRYDKGDWKAYVRRIWFELYPRLGGSRVLDSCGFEHVFVGEHALDKQGKPTVKGLHNWVMFHDMEVKGNLDYKGYLDNKGTQHNGANNCQLLGLQFAWNDKLKPASTMFVGTTPEFEMALYTMAWADQAHEPGDQEILVNVGGYNANLKCHSLSKKGQIDFGIKMSSCFPEQISARMTQAATKVQATFRGRLSRRGR